MLVSEEIYTDSNKGNRATNEKLIQVFKTSDPTKIAESFNKYFTSIAEKLENNIYFGNNNFAKYLNNPLAYNWLTICLNQQIVQLSKLC